METALTVWAGTAPEEAAVVVANLPASNTKQALLQNFAARWADDDPDAAMRWTQQLPAAAQPAAYEGLVPQLANNSPAAAAALLEKLPANSREQVAQHILEVWRETDAAAARAWLAKAPLPEEIRQRLLKP